jgi:hypothetical protein
MTNEYGRIHTDGSRSGGQPKEKYRQIGIDLINEYRVRGGFKPIDWLAVTTPEASAFIRSIQLHEKTKKELQDVKQELNDFRQEVSDVASVCAQHFCENSWTVGDRQDHIDMLTQFIIPKPKPDPLLAALLELELSSDLQEGQHDAKWIRNKLDELGFEIREKKDD